MEKILPKLRFLFVFLIIPFNHGKTQDVVVMDDILTPKILRSIEILLSSDQTQWNFNSIVSPRISNISGTDLENTHYWTTKFDPISFSGKPIWKGIKQQLAVKIGVTADVLHVRQVNAEISGRGDNTLAAFSCSKTGPSQEQGFVVVMFPMLNKWGKNSYGELVVYDDDGEILKSIHPRNGRVVLFDCGYSYVIKPPSMDCKERFQTLTIHISMSSDISEAKPKRPPQLTLEQRNTYYRHLITSLVDTSNVTALDVEKHITREFRTTEGHPIIVFDNIIPKNILDFFAEFIKNGTYANDPPSPESTDNVPWILAFDTETVTESPLWKYVRAIVKHTSKKDDFYPYDVGCNNIRSHDTTKIHLDCAPDEEEYTLLIYLNRNWTNNDLGETIFFNYESDHPNVRNEMVFAIKPKYGRVAIFHGTIPHSARPPTPLYHGMYTRINFF